MFTFHDLTKFANRISDENLTELIAINKNCSIFNYNFLNLTSNESSSQLDCDFNLNANVNQDDLKFITHYAITSRKILEVYPLYVYIYIYVNFYLEYAKF